MADDDLNPFAMRARARRASLLADVLRRKWDEMDDDLYFAAGLDLPDAAAALSDDAWQNAASEAGITVPSEITRNMVIGLLSVPSLQGLVSE